MTYSTSVAATMTYTLYDGTSTDIADIGIQQKAGLYEQLNE